MAESIKVDHGLGKEKKYEQLFPQLAGLMDGESDLVANLSNIAAALKESFNFFWVGFYLVKGQELVLGPFQGPVACTRIGFGKGVCGTAWKERRTIVVPDVDEFPGHIACSSFSKSEIVVPCLKNGEVVLILDVDSEKLNQFDEIDARWLERLTDLIAAIY